MNLKNCEKKEKNMAEIVVEVSAEELSPAINEAYKKNRNKIVVPGFRTGKAPRKIIERMYGASVFYNDALDIILPSVLSFAVKESGMRLVSFPRMTDVDIKDGGNGADITLTAAVYPEVTIGEYKGLSAVKPAAEVSESEIDGEVEAIQFRNARIETASRPANVGDTAVIDFEGFVDGVPFEGGKGEKYELVLGSNTFIPGFEEKVQGMTADDERDIDIVFPENYTEPLAGKAAIFKVKLHEVKEKILPELDDEFAKDVSEFDTIEEYRADIRKRLQKTKQDESDAAFENALMDKIIATLDGDIPEAMIEEHMNNSMEDLSRRISAYGMEPAQYLQMLGATPESFAESMRISSERQIKTMLALDKIAELENVAVSEEDIENEYKELSELYGKDIDKTKESVSREALEGDIKMRRAAKIVTESAVAEKADAGAAPSAEAEADTEKSAEKKPAAKKPAAKKPAAKAAADADEAKDAEKPVEKKPAAKKTAVKKPKEEAGASDENK